MDTERERERDGGGQRGRWTIVSAFLLAVWGLFIVYGTLFPFDFSAKPELVEARLRTLAVQPWKVWSWSDVVSNVLLFVPWGFLLFLHLRGRKVRFGKALAATAFGGFTLSAFLEYGQLFSADRITSLVDLATNVAGSVVGGLVGGVVVGWVSAGWTHRFLRSARARPLRACAAVAGLGLVLSGLSPFKPSLEIGALKAAAKGSRPIPFGAPLKGAAEPFKPWSRAREFLIWGLAGGVSALAFRESGWSGARVFFGVAALGGGLSLAIEAAQLVFTGHTADATTVVFAVVGSVVGAACVLSDPELPPYRWVDPALVVWVATAVLMVWTLRESSRLASTPGGESGAFAPFVWIGRHPAEDTMDRLLAFVWAFFPLGALLSARRGRGPIGGHALMALGIGVGIEVARRALFGTIPELADALAGVAGTLCGSILWRGGESVFTEP